MDVAVRQELVKIADRLATEAADRYPAAYIRLFRAYYTGLAGVVTDEIAASAPNKVEGPDDWREVTPLIRSQPTVAAGSAHGDRPLARTTTPSQQTITQGNGGTSATRPLPVPRSQPFRRSTTTER